VVEAFCTFILGFYWSTSSGVRNHSESATADSESFKIEHQTLTKKNHELVMMQNTSYVSGIRSNAASIFEKKIVDVVIRHQSTSVVQPSA
jgi:hypothetical protein